MLSHPLPNTERARLDRLREIQILDTEPEEWFDQISGSAAKLAEAPIALISFVDVDRQWIKSSIGTSLRQIELKDSFCVHAMQTADGMVVPDAQSDSRFVHNELVIGKHAIRSYASVPLKTTDGIVLGTLAVFDAKPRQFCENQLAHLKTLAALVVGHLELRAVANRAARAEQILIDAVDALPDGLVLYDKDDRLVLCNQRYKEIYAESADLIVQGARFEDIIRGGVERGQYPEAVGNEEEFIRNRVHVHQNPGEPIEQELPGDRWLRIQEGRTRDGGLIGFRFDVTQLKHQERELTRMAWQDGLTGIFNRTRFMELSGNEFSRSRRHKHSLAILLLDIDHFKQVNDLHGHAAGDEVLIELTRRWQVTLRSHDLLGRLGGEEFGVLLPETSEVDAFCVAEKLRQQTEETAVRYKDSLLDVTVSIGIGTVCDQTRSIDDILLKADKSLYEVKRNGRNGCLLYAA